MTDDLNDAPGGYSVHTHNELKAFVDAAVQSRIDELHQQNELRSKRFQLDAEKLRQAYRLHADDKPDPKTFGKTDELERWNQTLLELERKAQTAERQFRLHKRSLENPNLDVMKRAAKRYVAEEHPDKYSAYQASLKLHQVEKMKADLDAADTRLGHLIETNAPTRHINAAARRLSDVVTRLEKSPAFKELSGKTESQKLKASRERAEQVLDRGSSARGREFE